jgi:hypothetical protein
MKIHSLIISACILLVLSGLLYWSNRHKPDESKISADTPPAILKLDEGSINKLELKKKSAPPILLSKADSGEWRIAEPEPLRADQSTVSSMLSTVSSLNSERVIEEKASDLKNYGLDAPALEVDVSEKDGHSQKLLVGDDTPASGGAYAMLAGNPKVYTLASYNKSSLDKSLNDLRDKRLLPANADKVSRVELMRSGQDLEFGRNKDEWQILKPRPLRADSSQVSDLVRQLTEAKMDLTGTTGKDAESAFRKASRVAVAKITDQSGTQELEVRKDKDTYYARSSTVTGVYKVDNEVGKAVDKGLEDFRNKKLFDFGYDQPNKVELRNGPKFYALARSGTSEDWWLNGKKMDPASVDSLISKLRDLSAEKFPDSGFSNPTIEATVTSQDGKRTEKVLIAKSGNGYLAKRESEPALYQLEASPIDDLVKAADELKPASAPAGK